jgi:hypothetical protein
MAANGTQGAPYGLVTSSWLASARSSALLALMLVLGSASLVHAQRGGGHHPQVGVDRVSELGSPVRASSDPFLVDVTLATAFPTALGADVRVETPGRFLIDAFIGANPYGTLLGDLVQSYGGQEAGALVTAITSGSTVFRLGVGFRPAPDAGLEVLAGYTLLYAAPTLSVATLEATTGQSLAYSGLSEVRLETAIHALHAELGWRFVIADHLVFRIGVGGTFSLAATARLGVPDSMRTPGGPVEVAEHDIAHAITSYGFIPEARAAIGYRF